MERVTPSSVACIVVVTLFMAAAVLHAQTDTFERANGALGANWSANPDMVINNGNLHNQALTDGYNFLAVYTATLNPTEASVEWASAAEGVTESGLQMGGIVFVGGNNYATTNGYWIQYRVPTSGSGNWFRVWVVQNGSFLAGSSVDSPTFTQALSPGSTMRVVFNKTTYAFQCFIGGTAVATVTPTNKSVNMTTTYAGVMLRGQQANDVEGFSVSTTTDNTAPSAITNLSATALTASSIKLDWTATGDDGNTGTAASYDIRYATNAITAANFSSKVQVSGAPTPKAAGLAETLTVSNLQASTTYHFAIKVRDDAGNESGISNVPNATTPEGGGGGGGTTTGGLVRVDDDFNRAAFGGDWSITASHEIHNGEMALSAAASGWNYLATFVKQGAYHVGVKFSATNIKTDQLGGYIPAGLAVLLDAPSASANGFMIYRKDKILVFNITNGILGAQIQQVTGALTAPVAGDELKAEITDNGSTKTVKLLKNGQDDASFTLNSASNLDEVYGGVLLWGGASLGLSDHNNIDVFSAWFKSKGPSSIGVYAGNNQSGPIQQQLPDSVAVIVEDENGGAVEGVVVDFQLIQGQAKLDEIEDFVFDGKIWKEVEAGNLILSTATIEEDAGASGQAYVTTPYVPGLRDKRAVEIPIYVPEEKTYEFWLRYRTDSSQRNGIYVSFDSDDSTFFEVTNYNSVWTWVKLLTQSLTAGRHKVNLIVFEPGWGWDKILVVDTNLSAAQKNPGTGVGGTGPFVPNVTNASGIAYTHVTFKTNATPVVIEVSGFKSDDVTPLDGSPVTFNLQPIPHAATKIAKDPVTDRQKGAPGEQIDLRVFAQDEFNNKVPGVTINWAVTFGDATVNPAQSTTNSQGAATTKFTFGSATDSFKVRATSPQLAGQEAVFTEELGKKIKTFSYVSGNNQTGIVGQQLIDPLVVQVLDEDSKPYENYPINFEVISGDGLVNGQELVQVKTNASGRASVTWELGCTPGQQKVRASVSVPAYQPIDFIATAQKGQPTKIVKISGDNPVQTGPILVALPNPFIVEVRDACDNPIANQTVKFDIIQGVGATLGSGGETSLNRVTDANGRAQVTLTMGTQDGEEHIVRVAAVTFTADLVTFRAIASGIVAVKIEYVSGNNQQAVVTNPLPAPFVVKVTDPLGHAAKNHSVTFKVTKGGGNFAGVSETTVSTDTTGEARATLTLGTSAGANSQEVQVSSNRKDLPGTPLTGSPVLFQSTGLPDLPAKLVKVATTDNQQGVAGQPLSSPLKASVTDIHGNPISSRIVRFQIQGKGGILVDPVSGNSVTSIDITTSTEGIASVVWTMPETLKTVPATFITGITAFNDNNFHLDGSPGTFTAVANAAPAYQQVKLTTQALQGTVAQPLAQKIRTRITDNHGNPVGRYNVTFTVTEGGGKVNNVTTVTVPTSTDSGIAQVTWKLGDKSGVENNLLEASAGNLAVNPIIVFKASGLPDVATQMIADLTTDNQIGEVGTVLPKPIRVQIVDQYKNGVPNYDVLFHVNDVSGNVGSIDGAVVEKTAKTGETGYAQVSWTLGPMPGSQKNELVASARRNTAHLAGSPYTFKASSQIGPPDSLYIVSGDNQTGSLGNPLEEPLRVKVVDAFGNPKAGHSVKFTVLTHTTGDGGTLDGKVDTVKTKTTDSNGIAGVEFYLGNRAGSKNHRVQARAEYEGKDLKGSPLIFYESAEESDAKSMAKAGGDSQTGTVGEFLPIELAVKALDEFGNPVRNHSIQFRVLTGNGTLGDDSLKSVTKKTGNDGIARLKWRLGTTVGANNNLVEATSSNGITPLEGSPLTFSANAIAGKTDATVSTIEAFPVEVQADPDNYRATIKVTLKDKFGNPVSGKAVVIQATGEKNIITNPTQPTDANGVAVGYLASSKAETKIVTARDVNNMIDLSQRVAVKFIPLAASNLDKAPGDNGDGQTGNIGTVLPRPLRVLVTDKYENPIANHQVRFAVQDGRTNGALVELQPVRTDSNGIAQSSYRLGEEVGLNIVQAFATDAAGANLSGSPQSFFLQGKKAVAVNLIHVSGNGGSARAGKPIPTLAVKVVDNTGSPLWGESVRFKALQGGGSITSANPVVSDMYGVASANGLAGTEFTGVHYFGAELVSNPSVTFTFGINVTADVAKKMDAPYGTEFTGTVGRTLAQALSVMTTDDYGNPVAGETVTFNVENRMNGGYLNNNQQTVNAVSDASGFASVSYTLGIKAGVNVVKATSSTLSPRTITFNITGQADLPYSMDMYSGNNQVFEMGEQLPEPVSVIFYDQYGNPARDGLARFAVTGGGGSVVEAQPVISNSKGLASVHWVLGPRPLSVVNTLRASSSLAGGFFEREFSATGVDEHWPDFQWTADGVSVNEGDTLKYTVKAIDEDPGDRVVQYQALRLPKGATFNTATQFLLWPTEFGMGGKTYYASFSATDTKNRTRIDSLAIQVKYLPKAPVIIKVTPPKDVIDELWGGTITFIVEAIDPNPGDILSYKWMLDGTVLSSTDSVYVWDTSDASLLQHHLSVTVSDMDGLSTPYTWMYTKVELSSFTSRVTPYEGVWLEWETSKEVGNAGFNVLKSMSENGVYTQINDELLPSSQDGKYRFNDKEVSAGQVYFYKIEDVSTSGFKTQHGPVAAVMEVPRKYDLSQNYPNPFNPTTSIRYELPRPIRVRLDIYNIMGQKVRTLVDEERQAGYHIALWNGLNDTGVQVGSGVYYYRIMAGDFVSIKKMAFLK